MGKVIYPRKGEVHTAPVTIPAVFADATWAQVIEACQTNTVPATWVVGDQKAMTINGKDYLIDIIGKNHDEYSDGSGTAPLTFQMHDSYGTQYAMNNTSTNGGGWLSCVMRRTHLPSILALMPSEVQAGIKEVRKLTTSGNQSSTLQSTNDKLFLLSEIEVIGKTYYSISGEGTQYTYYSAGNSTVKNQNGRAMPWYERSPTKNFSSDFCCISSDGSATSGFAIYERGVSFGFCF